MTQISVVTVGENAQPLAPGPFTGQEAEVFTVINLDDSLSVNIGSISTSLPLSIGPLASVTLNGPIWANASTQLKVGVLPGGGNYSPGSLTITGPVTATITGTVDVDVQNTTLDVNVTNSSIDVNVEGTADVSVQGTADINVTNANIDVVGTGGYIAPGAYSLVLNDTGTHTVTPGNSYMTSVYNMTTYQSYTIAVKAYCGAQANAGAPLCVPVVVSYYADSGGNTLIDSERWWMWLANASAYAVPIYGSGSLRGGYITVTVGNPVGSENVTVTEVNLYGAGRSFDTSIWQQTPPTQMNTGITMLTSAAPLTPLPGDDKILANESNNALTTTTNTYWQPMPLFSGQVSMYFQTAQTLASDFVVATAQGLQYGDVSTGTSTQGALWNPASVAGTAYTTDIEVGNAPMYFVVHTGATAPTFTYAAQGH
jgi:hypothetical protein